ncbi:hypothetical protein NL676_006530 [Syzygium grande]|nr:hypothetical protein NL676_006530 [Syzygium grande]
MPPPPPSLFSLSSYNFPPTLFFHPSSMLLLLLEVTWRRDRLGPSSSVPRSKQQEPRKEGKEGRSSQERKTGPSSSSRGSPGLSSVNLSQSNARFENLKGAPAAKTGLKSSKRNLKTDASTLLHQQERSNSDSLPDSSTSGDEYRALRRRYLLLEEESFSLGNELREVEKEVKVLEEEKFALLDKLVVLEGLIDPSELQM